VLAILASTGIMLLTWVAAWLGERSRLPARRLVDYVASAPLAFPAIVLGVGVLEFYLNMPVPIYGSLLILLIGYLTLFMPYGMRYLQPAVMHLSPELEEAAQIAGASPWVSFRNVVAPLTRSAFWAGWLFILLLVARELTLSVFLVSPGNEVVAVELFDLWNNGQLGQVAAFGVIWTAVMTVIALGFWKLVHRRDIELNV
jgi:iron(III) transport system permease protein